MSFPTAGVTYTGLSSLGGGIYSYMYLDAFYTGIMVFEALLEF